MSNANGNQGLCAEIDEHMSELLEGTASDELYDHLADCDRCRDARHDAERAIELAADSGADFEMPGDFEAQVLSAIDSAEGAAPTTSRGVGPSTDRVPEVEKQAVLEADRVEAARGGPATSRGVGPSTDRVPEVDKQAAIEADRLEAERRQAEVDKGGTLPSAAAAAAPAGATEHTPSAEREAAREGSVESATASSKPGSTLADPYAAGAPEPAPQGKRPAEVAKVLSLTERLRRPRNVIIAGAVCAAAAAAAVVMVSRPGDQDSGPGGAVAASAPWQGKVVRVSRAAGGQGGLELCDSAGASCRPAAADAPIEAGVVLKTDDRTRAYVELSDGTRLALDRSTELGLDAETDRRARLDSGAVVADVAHVEQSQARIDLPTGHLEVLGTKFAVRATGEQVAVDVSRGAVRLVDKENRSVTVRAGEEGRVYPGMAPYATGAPALGEAMAWSDSGEEPSEQTAVRGLGELRAKKPGTEEEKKGAVRLTRHKVKVRVVDGFARTEVDETFTNTTDEVLEGIYRFPMPPDAQIERLALEVDGHMEEGAFVDRDRAAAIWRGAIVNAAPKQKRIQEEIVWVPGPWKDPALLEWQRGGRFELRIFPIEKRSSRRVVLTYTQVVKPTGRVRRYVYPLAHDASGASKVDEFALDVQVKGHDKSFGLSSQGYALTGGGSSGGDAERLQYSANGFVPSGDLVVEYALPQKDSEVTAWAYQPTGTPAADDDAKKDDKQDDKDADGEAKTGSAGDAPYVALALRPKLPRSTEKLERAFVLLVDSSRSMIGERYRRASQVATRVIRELDRLDRFTVLACDTTCRRLPGGLRFPGNQAADEAKQFLGAVTPEGGSDVTAALREARSAASDADGRAVRIIYIGDGTPTVGPIRPRTISQAVREAFPSGKGTLTAVAIGTDSDLDALGAMARGGGGVVLPYVPGQRLAEATYAVLGASYGMGLRDISFELPAGLVEVAPTKIDTIPPGGEAIVVARMTRPDVTGTATLRGKVGSKDFEQRYPLTVKATTGAGNAFVPRLYAAVRIGDLEREGTADARKRAVELSGQFNVASRYTSLLVLESPAMFKAFGLDNTRRVATWTGEEDTDRSEAAGQLAVGPDDRGFMEGEEAPQGSSYGAMGAGRAKSSAPRPRMAAKPAPAPSSAPQFSADDLGGPSMEPPRRRGRMVPMRKIWERVGSIQTAKRIPTKASASKLGEAEQAMRSNENSRTATKNLYNLYFLAGQIDQATKVAERWSEKEALDVDALTARADLAASAGKRDESIRILGSVVDVRPGDIPSQRRLARLHRWAGRPALGCRHTVALAQLREKDAKLLAEAVHCARKTGESRLSGDLLAAAEEATRKSAERQLDKMKDPVDTLRGELRLEATWQGDQHDLDLALLHPDGHRVSWLGAPTKALISASDVTSTKREGLALLGSKAGEYVIEIVRVSGGGAVRGEITVRAAGQTRKIPFDLAAGQTRLSLGLISVRWQSRLVPM